MNKSEELFMRYCRESGMDEDDIRACSWHKAGMIDFADWLISQNSGKPIVSGSLPPTDELRTAVEKLLEAVKKHHPMMNMETQLDLYMSYHDVKKSLGGNDR